MMLLFRSSGMVRSPRAMPRAPMAMDAADGIVVPGAAPDDLVHELAVAAQAVVLEDLAVLGLDADGLFEDQLRAGLVGPRRLEGEAGGVVVPVQRLGQV